MDRRTVVRGDDVLDDGERAAGLLAARLERQRTTGGALDGRALAGADDDRTQVVISGHAAILSRAEKRG
jgi:hypothetical protein